MITHYLKTSRRANAEGQILPRVSVSATALLAVIVLLSACGTEPPVRRGSLSDAMDKSKDRHRGSREVPERRAPDDDGIFGNGRSRGNERPRDNDDGRDNAQPVPSDGVSIYDSDVIVWGFRGGSSLALSGDMGRDLDIDVLVGAKGDPMLLMFYGGLKTIAPKAGSDLDESVDGSLIFLKAGGEIRYFPFPDGGSLSPYVGIGVGAFMMGWEFRNTLLSDGEKIEGDSLKGIVVSAPLGVRALETERFDLLVSLTPEIYVFGDLTEKGFDNDYFKPCAGLRLSGEINIH